MASPRRALAVGLGLLLLGAGEVPAQTVAELEVLPPNVSLPVGQRQGVVATAYDARGQVLPTVKITWSSNNVQVARVEPDSRQPGVATIIGVAAGVAYIEAEAGGRRGTVQVQVGGAGGAIAQPAGAVMTSTAAAIRIDPNAVFLLPSEDTRLAVAFLQADGTPAVPMSVTVRSLNEAVATIGPDGSVIGIAPGQGVVEVRAPSGLVARATVQVSTAPFTFGTEVLSLAPAQQESVAVIVPTQNNRRVASKSVTWTSTNPVVVTVSPLGIATGMSVGRAEIFASGFGQTARLPVVVHRAVEELRLAPPQGAINVPLSGSLAVTAEPMAADGGPVPEAPLVWRVADTSVAAYDSAAKVVRGKKIGRTRLTVRGPGRGLEAGWTIDVVAGGLGLVPEVFGLIPGERHNVIASFVNDQGQSIGPATGVQWTSLNPAIATVDNQGAVQGVAYGHARIVAATTWGKADTAHAFVQGEILVNSTRRGNVPKLYAFDRVAPTRFIELTRDTTHTETEAAFAPDGGRIAYVTDRDGNAEIYVMNADGSDAKRLTNTPATEAAPSWTPDGRHLVYASNAAGTTTGNFHIWIMNADGSGQRALTQGQFSEFQPAVSPDGQSVAFTTDRDGNYNIYLMGIDGTAQRAFTTSPTPETTPAWFPDGQLGYLQQQPGRNTVASRVMRANASTREAVPLSPEGLTVSDFDVSKPGDLLALVVTMFERNGTVSQKLYLLSLAVGAAPIEIPAANSQDRLTSPAFRR